jgi:hypothetical protein
MKHGLFYLALLLGLVPACGGDPDDNDLSEATPPGPLPDESDPSPPDQREGALQLDWAVKGGRTELDCSAAGANFILVEATNRSSALGTKFTGSCSLLSATVSLAPDDYERRAALLNGATQLTRVVSSGPSRFPRDSLSPGPSTSRPTYFDSRRRPRASDAIGANPHRPVRCVTHDDTPVRDLDEEAVGVSSACGADIRAVTSTRHERADARGSPAGMQLA